MGPGCSAKEARIEAEIADATSRGQKHRLTGLQKALGATRANCTEQSRKNEREARIRKAKQEVAEREKDLLDAEKSGDVDKVNKRRVKAAEARRELVNAEKS